MTCRYCTRLLRYIVEQVVTQSFSEEIDVRSHGQVDCMKEPRDGGFRRWVPPRSCPKNINFVMRGIRRHEIETLRIVKPGVNVLRCHRSERLKPGVSEPNELEVVNVDPASRAKESKEEAIT
jgi:hypothetical protein